MQIDVMGDLKRRSEVQNSSCIVCLKCVDDCPTDSLAFSLRRHDAALSHDAAVRTERSTRKRRKRSAFDVAITLIWVAVSAFFFFSGARASAPQEMKVVMSVGLLLIVYGLVWTMWKTWNKLVLRPSNSR